MTATTQHYKKVNLVDKKCQREIQKWKAKGTHMGTSYFHINRHGPPLVYQHQGTAPNKILKIWISYTDFFIKKIIQGLVEAPFLVVGCNRVSHLI